jgi:putative flavoprotein involved in K+ transport
MSAVQRHQVVVVGAGQGGLSVGHHLAAHGIDFVIVDGGARLGDAWRQRWDSLRLFTPARYDGLPGFPFPRDERAFPSKDEMADYLASYAAREQLPVRLATRITALDRSAGGFLLTADSARFEAEQVVIATGSYQKPRVPSWAIELHRVTTQLHAGCYKNPRQLPEGDVLVVGAGNSGAELALEAARAGHRVFLSGRDVGRIPPPLYLANGRFFWFLATRVLTDKTPMGRKIRAHLRAGHGGPLIRIRPRELVEAGIERVARVAGVEAGWPLLDDGRVLEVSSVLWCNGFSVDFSWVRLPIFAADGLPVHEQGRVAAVPGLYFVGLPFQRSFSSMFIGGVGRDAERVAEQLVRERGERRQAA